MGFGEFWLQSNNGKKVSRDDLQKLKDTEFEGNEALQKLFSVFDSKKQNGVLNKKELNSLFADIQDAAKRNGDEEVLDIQEAEAFLQEKEYRGKTLADLGVKASDLFEFLSKIVKCAENTSTNEVSEVPAAAELPEEKPVQSINDMDFVVELTEEQAQDAAISEIVNDAAEAKTILMQQDNGVISDAYNRRKERKDKDLALSNVEEAIDIQQKGADNLLKAKQGELSKREYFLQNREHLKLMMKRRLFRKDENTGLDFLDRNKGKLSKEEFALKMENYINEQLDSIEEIDSLIILQHRLLSYTDEQVEQILNKYYENVQAESLHNSYTEQHMVKLNIPRIPEEFDSTEPMTFEEVYKLERGIEYSKFAVEIYLEQKQKTDFALGAYNKYQSFKSPADEYIKHYEDETRTYATGDGNFNKGEEPNPEERAEKAIDIFVSYYGYESAQKEIDRLIITNHLPVILTTDNEGNLKFDMSNIQEDAEKNAILNELVSLESDKLKGKLEQILGGDINEKLEFISKKTERYYTDAYGSDFTTELAQAMEEDNKTFIQKYTGDVAMGGMGVSLVGGILCFTPLAGIGVALVGGGGYVAMGSMAAESGLGYAEAYTRANVDDEEIKELTKTLIMNAGGFVVGMAANGAGMKAFNKLIDKKLAEVFKMEITNGNKSNALKLVFSNPEYLTSFLKAAGVKLSTDFVISYAGDLAMMGVLDTKDDWMSLLRANLIGIAFGLGGDIKDVSGAGIKNSKLRTLSQKEKSGNITSKEASELAALRQDPDIQKAELNDEVETEIRKESDQIKAEDDGVNKNTAEQNSIKAGDEEVEGAVEKISPEKPIEILSSDEFYEKILDMKDSDGDYIFNSYDTEIMKETYKQYPKAVLELLEYKCQNGNLRFDAGEISYLAKLYDEKPMAVKELIEMKNLDGSPRLSGWNIKDLFNMYQEDPQVIKDLLSIKNPDGSPRLDAITKKLFKMYKEYPDAVRELAEMRASDGMPRFYEAEIAELAEVYENYPKAVIELSEMITPDGGYRFSADGISTLAEVYEKYPKAVIELSEIKDPDGYSRFGANEIYILAETYDKHPKAVIELSEMRDSEGNLYFGPRSINTLAPAYEKYPKAVIELSEMKKDNGHARFSADDVASLAKAYDEYPQAVIELAAMKNQYGNDRFGGYEINKLVTIYAKSPKATKEMLEMRRADGNFMLSATSIMDLSSLCEEHSEAVLGLLRIRKPDGTLRFSGYEIKNLIEVYEVYPKAVIELAEIKNPDGTPRFSDHAIQELAEVYEKYPKAVIELSEMKNPDGTERFKYYDIIGIAKLYEEYPKAVKELLEMKTPEGSYRFDKYQIMELTTVYEKYPKVVIEMAEIIDENGKPMFSAGEISHWAEEYSYRSKTVKELMKMKDTDGKPIFGGTNAIYLAETYEKYPKAVIELSAMKAFDGGKRFDVIDIKALAESYEEHSTSVSELAEIKNPDGSYRLNGNDIKNLAEVYETRPKAVKELIEIKKPDGSFRFDGDDIKMLAEIYEIFPRTVKDLLDMKTQNGNPRFSAWDIVPLSIIYELHPDTVKKLAGMENLDGSGRFSGQEIVSAVKVYNEHPKTANKLLDMRYPDGRYIIDKKGINDLAFIIKSYDDNPKHFEKIINIAGEGSNQIYFGCILRAKNCDAAIELLRFFNSDSYAQEIKQNSAGKYQQEVIDLFDINSMPSSTMEDFISSGMSKADFLTSIKKLSKSTFKLAYDTPNQYLSGIDLKYSTPVDGELPKLSGKELEWERETVVRFFKNNIVQISRALKYLDTDTVSHMMDRRTDLFESQLEELNKLTDDNYALLSKGLTCKSVSSGKPLSPREKIQLCQMMEIFQQADIDITPVIKAISSGEVDLVSLKQIIQDEVLKAAGVNPDEVHLGMQNKKFNEEFSYLALGRKVNEIEEQIGEVRESMMTSVVIWRKNKAARDEYIKNNEEMIRSPMFANVPKETKALLIECIDMVKDINRYTDEQIVDKMMETVRLAIDQNTKTDELYVVIRESVTGDFKKFITDESNKYGQTNKRTRLAFEAEHLDYDKWDNPEIEDVQLEVAGKKMSIRLWSRYPQEDLFMGNKTTCCTAIGTGGNAAATPVYLLNTSYNVVQLFDSAGNVVGMSRVFMGKIDGKPTLIMDNIELNRTFVKGMTSTEKITIRDAFFDYMNQYAEQVTGDSGAQVLFYSGDIHVPNDDLSRVKKVTYFIGDISQETVYVNAAKCSWQNPAKLDEFGEIEWLVVPRKNKVDLSGNKSKEISTQKPSESQSKITDESTNNSVMNERQAKISESIKNGEQVRAKRIGILERHKIESNVAKHIDDKIFALDKSDTQAIKEIKKEIEALKLTHPEEAKNLEILLNALTKDMRCDEVSDEEIGAVVNHLIRQYSSEEAEITNLLKSFGIDDVGAYGCRIKSDTSMFDKIANYAKDNPDKPFSKAIGDVRDAYGGRIVLKSEDMTRVPEIKALLDAGRVDEAAVMAADISSTDAYNLIRKMIESDEIEVTRLSNYADGTGLALFSDARVYELQSLATDKGLYVEGLRDSDDLSKKKDSGYPALQINLKTKTGRTIELQIRFDTVDEFAEAEHLVYDSKTNKDIIGRHEEISGTLNFFKFQLPDFSDETVKKTYDKYTQAIYRRRFLKAFGIEIDEPKLPEGIDEGLSEQSLIELHNIVEDLKKSAANNKKTD